MTDAERAAELADRAERDGYIDISDAMTDEAEEMRIWIKGARLLAEQSAPSPDDLREVVARAIDPAAFIENPMMVMQPRRAQTDAFKNAAAVLSAISAAGYVIIPGNTDWIREANEIARAQWPCNALAAKEGKP